MADILGVDFLTNPKITESSGDIKLPDLTSIELPSFGEVEHPMRLSYLRPFKKPDHYRQMMGSAI